MNWTRRAISGRPTASSPKTRTPAGSISAVTAIRSMTAKPSVARSPKANTAEFIATSISNAVESMKVVVLVGQDPLLFMLAGQSAARRHQRT